MAHFAEIDSNNTVTRVVVVANQDLLAPGSIKEDPELGLLKLRKWFGDDTRWVQTSYNGNFHKNYAGVGMIWDEARKAFRETQPYPSWTLDEQTCKWNPPVERPASIVDGANVDESESGAARCRWSEVEYNNTGNGWIILDDANHEEDPDPNAG